MINFAHRGASWDYPENTILAFEEAIKCGATGIELDVHKSKDNKLVVIHDEDIERTYRGRTLIKDNTLEELRKFKCRKALFTNREDCYIPELEEVLKLIENKEIFLNIELKTDVFQYEDIEEDVIDLIKKYNMKNRVIISSFNHASIMKCKLIDNEIMTGILYSKPIEKVIDYAKGIGANALHPSKELVSEGLIREAHKNNLKVNVYTVNNPIHMRKLIEVEADGLFTDMPCLLKEILG